MATHMGGMSMPYLGGRRRKSRKHHLGGKRGQSAAFMAKIRSMVGKRRK